MFYLFYYVYLLVDVLNVIICTVWVMQSFSQTLSQSQSHSAAGRIKSIKNPNDSIGNLTRDLPARSSMPRSVLPPSWQELNNCSEDEGRTFLAYGGNILPLSTFSWSRRWEPSSVMIWESQTYHNDLLKKRAHVWKIDHEDEKCGPNCQQRIVLLV